MEKFFFGKFPRLIIVTLCFYFLTSCASSNVTREASSNVDLGVANAKSIVNADRSQNALGDTYQNTSQAFKGGLIGGGLGAVAGSVGSLGFLPATVAGVILGASYGSYIDSNTSIRDRLENRGLKVVILGDHVLIVIPSARIFDAFTSRIKPQAYSTLELVAQYINRFHKTLVKISAYTSPSASTTWELALSEQQAIALEKFLIASEVNARLLYAQGYGATNLVEPSNLGGYVNENYRIEITFTKLA